MEYKNKAIQEFKSTLSQGERLKLKEGDIYQRKFKSTLSQGERQQKSTKVFNISCS